MNKGKLSLNGFAKYPVWKWNDSQESHEPVENWQPLKKDNNVFFIKANFTTVDGLNFEGYLIGLDTFYAIGVFVKGEHYVMNFNLLELVDKSIEQIRKKIDVCDLNLFPLSYESEVCYENGELIKGVINRP